MEVNLKHHQWKVILDNRGVRIRHGKCLLCNEEFVEWPILTKDGKIKLASYEFDGERSSGMTWEELPETVQRLATELLKK
jgi:hypothetical protein